MLPYVCPVFNIWLEYPELPLLFLIIMCVLYILSRMFGPFSLCILVGDAYISFGIRHFFRIYQFAGGFY
jgi:hypothetical protein